MSQLDTAAKIEQVKESHEYIKIARILASFQWQIAQILDANKWETPSLYFTTVSSELLDKQLDRVDMKTIRTLKQALNNYFCTKVFETFRNKIDWVKSCTLVFPSSGKIKELDTEDFFYNSVHPLPLTFILKLVSFTHSFKVSLWKFLSQKTKENIRNYYFNVWQKIVKHIFLQILQEVVYENDEQKSLFGEYLALESYVLKKTSLNGEQGFCSIIDFVFLNDSITYLKKYISEELKGKIEIDKIKEFLSKQAEYEKKLSVSMKLADIANFFEFHWGDGMVFSQERWYYVINPAKAQECSTHGSEITWLKSLQWCPFARTELSNGENAFITMFEILNEYYVVILEMLQKKGI